MNLAELENMDGVTEDDIRENGTLLTYDDSWECYTDSKGRVYAVATKKAKVDSLKAKISFARVPSAYSLTKISSIKPTYYSTDVTQELMIIQDYASGFERHLEEGRSLYIWSHITGSGKTMTACAIANELITRGISVLFMTSEEMFRKLRQTYDDDAEYSEEQVLRKLRDCDLLVFDDMGAENMSKWTDEKMFAIVNERYLQHKPILYTSNYAPDELKYNKRIIDRLKSNCTILHWPENGVRARMGDVGRKKQETEWHQQSLPV